MTDREALYRAVLENPDDDTLRLVYADALEEEGNAARAAFIRAQVQFAHVPEYDPAWIRARHHERDRAFGARWTLELPELPDGLDWAREPFRRGFPANIQARDAAAFVAHADGLFAEYPVESVELGVAQLAGVRQFALCPWVSRLVRLSVGEGLGAPSARRLLDSPHYQRLRELHIGAGLTTAATATEVVRSRIFRRLTTLGCRDDRGGGRALITELTRLADPPRLKVLDLSGNRLNAEQLTRLLAAPALAVVGELDLSDNNLRAESLRAITAARLPHLRSLHLLRTQPEEAGVRALAASGLLGELRSLTLGGNNLPPGAAVVLGASPYVANLRVLDLRENRLGDIGATALAVSPHFRNLVHIDLASNLIEDDGADALAESSHLAGLICLDLHGNVISPPAAARLKRRFGERVFL
jgi:uncharacterized protein (TIGR02996 family)